MPALHRLRSGHGFAWVLWLALLLPVAQSAATWHGYSHNEFVGGERGGKQAPHAGQCDLCLTAAAVTGGALAAQGTAVALLGARDQAPRDAARAVCLALATLAYQSRAPPQA